MYKTTFLLQTSTINPFPLGKDCYYITGTYKVLDSGLAVIGNATFQSWIYSDGTGSGMLVVDLLPKKIFYLQTLDIFQESIFRHVGMGFAGGIFIKCQSEKSLEYGFLRFQYRKKEEIVCDLQASVLEDREAGNIPLYQQYVLTDAQIYSNTIQPGNPKSVYRVGELIIRDAVTNEIIGENYFQNYPSNENNRGIGMSVYNVANQVFYSILSVQYSDTIEDPTSSVTIQAVVSAGQKYMRSFVQGRDYTIPREQDYLETIVGINRSIPLNEQIVVDCVLTDLNNFQVFQLQPNEPKSIVRIGRLTIIDNLSDRRVIGSWLFQTYRTARFGGIGTGIIDLQYGALRGRLYSMTIVIQSGQEASVRRGITAGDGDFQSLLYGYIDTKLIVGIPDIEARIVFSIQKIL